MKRSLLYITAASIITLLLYIVLYAVWGAVLNDAGKPKAGLFLLAVITLAAFSFLLVFLSKNIRSQGENEVVQDYKDTPYTSFAKDFKIAVRREYKTLVCMAIIIFSCFALNTFDRMVIGKKTVSHITFLFAPMCLLDEVIGVPFVGYALSVVLANAFYLFFLLIYRKRQYRIWFKS